MFTTGDPQYSMFEEALAKFKTNGEEVIRENFWYQTYRVLCETHGDVEEAIKGADIGLAAFDARRVQGAKKTFGK